MLDAYEKRYIDWVYQFRLEIGRANDLSTHPEWMIWTGNKRLSSKNIQLCLNC